MAYATKRISRNGIIALCDNGGEVFKINLETRRYAVARNITDDSVKAEINRELERAGKSSRHFTRLAGLRNLRHWKQSRLAMSTRSLKSPKRKQGIRSEDWR